MAYSIRKTYWAPGGEGLGGGGNEYSSPPTATPNDGTTTQPPADPGGGTGTPSGGGAGPADVALQTAVDYGNMSVMYYKINLESTKTNMYGEALEKWYYPPLQTKCLITREAITNSDDEFGVTVANTITVSIPRITLDAYQFIPEVGDVLMDREKMYEVNSIDQNFITLPGGADQSQSNGTAGVTVVFVLSCYLTRLTKLNLIEYYQ
jgi:hypothetical protein